MVRLSIAALAWLLTVSPAAAQPWVVRELAPVVDPSLSAGFRSNADVMVDAAGKVTVVSALMISSSFGGGRPIFAELEPGQTFFNDRADEVGLDTVELSGQLGPDELVQIAGRSGVFPRRFHGQDFGQWVPGGVQAELLESSGHLTSFGPTLALDQQGIPTVAWFGSFAGRPGYFATRFDPALGQWTDPQTLRTGIGGPNRTPPAVAFDSQNRRYTAMALPVNPIEGRFEVHRQDGEIESLMYSDELTADRGVSIAAGPNDDLVFAYVQGNTVKVGTQNALGVTIHDLTNVGSAPQLLPRSLTFDANGDPAILIGHRHPTSENAVLARLIGGAWQTETLPVQAAVGTVTFDAANNPYIASVSGEAISLVARNIAPVVAGDFDLDTDVDADDLDDFVQAVKQQATYRAAVPAMDDIDFHAIGDVDDDFAVDEADARAFADALITDPVSGLADRSAGYLAFDFTNANAAVGEGDLNFFNTTIATGKPYQAGESRADLSGPAAGVADAVIDDADIDYLFAQRNAGAPDLRADLNDDGLVNAIDTNLLVLNILGTFFGDANLDRQVDENDLQLLAANWQAAGGWATGDFNGDGFVDVVDLGILATNWQAGVPSPSTQTFADAWAAAQLAVPEPTTLALLALNGLAIVRRGV